MKNIFFEFYLYLTNVLADYTLKNSNKKNGLSKLQENTIINRFFKYFYYAFWYSLKQIRLFYKVVAHSINKRSMLSKELNFALANKIKLETNLKNKETFLNAKFAFIKYRQWIWIINSELVMSKKLFSTWKGALNIACIRNYDNSNNNNNNKDCKNDIDEIENLSRNTSLSICVQKNIELPHDSIPSLPYSFLSSTIKEILNYEVARVQILSLNSISVNWIEHGTSLLSSWDIVMEELKLYNKNEKLIGKGGKRWVNMGFQGKDPCTDFRSTGKLGLLIFNSWCINDSSQARKIIIESGSIVDNIENRDDLLKYLPKLKNAWYSASLASIHITSYLIKMLQNRELDKIMLSNLPIFTSQITDYKNFFFTLHDYIFNAFHIYWKSALHSGSFKSVMEFETFFQTFVRSKLHTIISSYTPQPSLLKED